VVNQSQIDRLFDIYEYVGSGEGFKTNDSTQGGTETQTEELQSHTGPPSDGSCADLGGLCEKETNELFELCEEIQNIVREENPCSLATGVCDKRLDNIGDVDNGLVVEKVYVSVEDEKAYVDVKDEKAYVDVENGDKTENEIVMVEYEDEDDKTNDYLLLPDELVSCDTQKDINNDSLEEYSKSPININYLDLFQTQDLFKDYDSIIDSYPSPNLNDSHSSTASSSSSTSPSSASQQTNADVGDGWEDLLTELFPSLSSL